MYTSNLVPTVFLQMLKQLELSELGKENYDVVLAALDIKDAFLQLPQQHVVSVNLHGTEYVVLRNLPAPRLGANMVLVFQRICDKQHELRMVLSSTMSCEM